MPINTITIKETVVTHREILQQTMPCELASNQIVGERGGTAFFSGAVLEKIFEGQDKKFTTFF